MIIELPVTADYAQSFTAELGEFGAWDFDIAYNSRSGVWSLSMTDSSTGDALFHGIPIVLGTELLEPYNFGIGRLIAQDKTAAGLDATVNDLGSRVALYWISPDETFQ